MVTTFLYYREFTDGCKGEWALSEPLMDKNILFFSFFNLKGKARAASQWFRRLFWPLSSRT